MFGEEALTRHHFPSHALWKEFPLSARRQSFLTGALCSSMRKT